MVALPDHGFVLKGIGFGVGLTSAGLALGAGGHAVVVVAELVEQNVKELVGADTGLVELAEKVAGWSFFTRDPQALEDSRMVFVITVGALTP